MRTLVGDVVEVVEPGTGVLPVDQPQEGAALAALGADQAGQPRGRPAELAQPLGRVEVLHPHPQVGLDDVRREQGAVHVEDRDHLMC